MGVLSIPLIQHEPSQIESNEMSLAGYKPRPPRSVHSPTAHPHPSPTAAPQHCRAPAPTPRAGRTAAGRRAVLYQQPRANRWLQPRHPVIRRCAHCAPGNQLAVPVLIYSLWLFFFFFKLINAHFLLILGRNWRDGPSGQRSRVQQTVTLCSMLLYLMFCVLDSIELPVPTLISSLFCR